MNIFICVFHSSIWTETWDLHHCHFRTRIVFTPVLVLLIFLAVISIVSCILLILIGEYFLLLQLRIIGGISLSSEFLAISITRWAIGFILCLKINALLGGRADATGPTRFIQNSRSRSFPRWHFKVWVS